VEHLDGDLAAVGEVVRQVDRGHAAGARRSAGSGLRGYFLLAASRVRNSVRQFGTTTS
jgi:hypothetical protein